ncbi:hypothetical protein [Marinicella rhabdoformis]|uniref:hypothetical protein n=1 Tax=Marinicella rhabdoformis TaxID=2580566 RepID=UPI0012AEC3CE|nr:hypothetical protein [Marinicella rhabdoformis]
MYCQIKSWIVALSLIVSTSAFSQPDEEIDTSSPHDLFWNGFSEGCIGRNIISDVFWFEFNTEMSLNSFTLGYMPDTNNGPAFLARLDTGTSNKGFFSSNDNPPSVFLAYSMGVFSCIVKTDFKKCPKAQKAYDLISNTKISLKENFKNKFGIKASHYTRYNLQVMDGAAHFNQWELTSGKSDMEKSIIEAHKLLFECAEPAAKQLFEKLGKEYKKEVIYKSH